MNYLIQKFFKYILLIMLLQFSQFPHYYLPSALHPTTLQHSPPQFMSMGCTCKYLEFSVSYTIFISPHLFYAYQLCFFFPVPFPHVLPSPSPLKILDGMSISLILFLFQLFAQFLFSLFFFLSFFFFRFFVDSCQFVVILLFIVFDLQFLSKCL